MQWKKITKDELKYLIDNNTYTNIGKMFNISDTAIRRKAKRLGIWKRKIKYNGHNKQFKKYKYCLWCGKEIDRKKEFCNHSCNNIYKHYIYINKWKLGLVKGVRSNGFTISNYIRKYLFDKYDNKCSRCGWNTPNPYIGKVILEIEHIDGDCTNNKEENLDLICPNCHSLTSTYKALNKGNGNRKRLMYNKLIDKNI